MTNPTNTPRDPLAEHDETCHECGELLDIHCPNCFGCECEFDCGGSGSVAVGPDTTEEDQ